MVPVPSRPVPSRVPFKDSIFCPGFLHLIMLGEWLKVCFLPWLALEFDRSWHNCDFFVAYNIN